MATIIKAIDFFCGAGGMTRGLLDAGLTVLAGIDNDKRLRETYETNNSPSQFFCLDARELDIHDLRLRLGICKTDTVVYAACTPCQPFSSLNRAARQDDRKDLLIAFGELVRQAPPDFIIVENVPGLHHSYGLEIQKKFLEQIRSVGFDNDNVLIECLDAAEFSVPQTRKRFIMMASRHGPVKKPIRGRKRLTVKDAISRYDPLVHGSKGESKKLLNHEARKLMDHHLKLVRAVPKDGGSRKDVQDETLLLKCHRRKPKVHKDVFGRMAWSKPSPTMTRRCTDVYCGRFAHPDQDRGISLREAAALQTFPDDYEFFGTFHHIAGQIGNAVPVRFARRLGEAAARSLD
jgi:DNA (cytosine-5)-methyltransferase 1